MDNAVQAHYDSFLAPLCSWMSGGFHAQAAKNRQFFSAHALRPQSSGVAVDLGAGCGFQSIPLAILGFSVSAVDSCQSLLDELHRNTAGLPVRPVAGELRDYLVWSGLHPELITCMCDTLTHLPDMPAVRDFIRHCCAELEPGGMFILSLRDYSKTPAGTTDCIPVRRDSDRIFICRLKYHDNAVAVEDILYSCRNGHWQRRYSNYTKIRIAPETLTTLLTGAGFGIEYSVVEDSIITLIARKGT